MAEEEYGTVEVRTEADLSVTVLHADPVIGISAQMLSVVNPNAIRVTAEGHLSFGSDGMVIYRPVRFAFGSEPPWRSLVLICERVK